MISLHHAHLMASDVEATIAFWREPGRAYAMAQSPDGLLLELFQPDPASMPEGLAGSGYFTMT